MKILVTKLIYALLLLPTFIHAQNRKEALSPVLFEHLRINVVDKAATAKWYVDIVGLEIVPSENENVIYVADKDHNFMIELSQIPDIRNTYSDIDLNSFHLAFEGHKTIEQVAERILDNGGTQEGKLYRNKVGDFVLNARDPNGFISQLIHRVVPFYPEPVKSTIRFEHFAFNTPDQKIAALWYLQFMNLIIPWSKDIDVNKDNFRNYRVPYIGDSESRMTFELFAKDVENSLANQSHEVIHIAFNTNEPEKLAAQMIYGGARQLGEKRQEKNGDIIIDLYDPRGVPIRLIKRKKAIL